jgi:hypothetical protein
MRPPGLQAGVLSGDYIKNPDTVVVSTLNDLKGFEFNLVVVIGCDEGVCPASDVAEGEVWRDALRFYVCMTRARDQVSMLYEDAPSPFLRQMQDCIVWLEESLLEDYQPAPPTSAPPPATPRMRFTNILARKGLRPHESCVGHLSKESLDVLRVFFNSKVDKSKSVDCRGYNANAMDELERMRTEEFHHWVTPSNLSRLRRSSFSRWRQIGRKALLRLDQELRSLGITTFLPKK